MDYQAIPPATVEVPEIEFKRDLQLPAEKSAVIVVDMQNDFVKEGGTLMVPAATATIEPIQSLLTSARGLGVPVIYTQDTHYEDDPEWQIWPEHCRHASWGWQIIDELAPQGEELVFQKARYDGFYGTGLDHHLRVMEIEHLVIVGTVSSICVLHTAASAGLRWYHVVVPANGVSALTTFDQALTLRQVSWLYTGSVVESIDDITLKPSS